MTEEEEIDPEMGGWALLLLVRGFNGPPSSASEAAGVVVPGDWCGEVNPAAGPGGDDRRGSRGGGGAAALDWKGGGGAAAQRRGTRREAAVQTDRGEERVEKKS